MQSGYIFARIEALRHARADLQRVSAMIERNERRSDVLHALWRAMDCLAGAVDAKTLTLLRHESRPSPDAKGETP